MPSSPGLQSDSFDEHERPTAQRARLEGERDPQEDPNATTRIKKFELDQVLQKGSGTRPVVTPEQIDRYRQEREELPAAPPAEPATDARDRETVDALALQRETLLIQPPDSPQTTAQQIPIDIDLSRIDLPVAVRKSPPSNDRPLVVIAGIVIAMIFAVLGFVAGRL